MNQSRILVVGIALLLTACATQIEHPRGYSEFGVTTLNVASLSVQVAADETIVVSQEPVLVQQSTDNTIYWSLPRGGQYYFPNTGQNPGIKFDNPAMPQTRCDLYNEDKWTYVCTYKRANRAKYPYTIRVTKNGSDILKSDPTVMNR